MKFILPTQHAPNKEVLIGELKIQPNKRVKIDSQNGCITYWDSMTVESPEENWATINEWLTFHSIIFNDLISLDWYEGQNFCTDKLIPEGDCACLVDYSNISDKIYFPDDIYPEVINYENLYKKYVSSSEENKSLVKNYFNSFDVIGFESVQRKIRNDSFLRISVLFSIVESIIGDAPKCPIEVKCDNHGKIFPHNEMPMKDWLKTRLTKIISDQKKVDEYLEVILEVREKLRHKTVHKGAISKAHFIQQSEREITWNWAETTGKWNENSTALQNLKIQMSAIARNLLLDKIFDLHMFPALHPLHSVTIN